MGAAVKHAMPRVTTDREDGLLDLPASDRAPHGWHGRLGYGRLGLEYSDTLWKDSQMVS